jgi:cytochrome c oxidase accessory protein FixG
MNQPSARLEEHATSNTPPSIPDNGEANHPLQATVESALLRPEKQVLATLRADGSRKWLFPQLATGYFWNRRRFVAYFLIGIFTLIPHLRMGGKPLVLLDVPGRRFTLFGYTYLPTDTLLLALLMVGGFLTIFAATALFGRVWCGWGCPQTVYMEFVFRPLDRLLAGTKGKGGQPSKPLSTVKSVARLVAYLVICMFLTHTFLAYFVGVERLAVWIRQSPLEHPIPFLVMAVTTGLMMFDFLYFREQTCLVACPYGRFQSVMLDRQSLIVTYDLRRGEPRAKGSRTTLPVVETPQVETTRRPAVGDCIDCGACVRVCPTGIDIRNGLQMECIHCSQCIDACDDVMQRVKLPTGLIRYSNQASMEGKPVSWLRPRLAIYGVALCLVFGLFGYFLATKSAFDAQLFRGYGNSFSVGDEGLIDNTLKLNLANRSDSDRTYRLKILSPPSARIRLIESELVQLKAGDKYMFPILISAPFEQFSDAHCLMELEIVDNQGERQVLPYTLLGPYQKPAPRTP